MSKFNIIGLLVLGALLITACGSDAIQVDEVDPAEESASEVAVENIEDAATAGEGESQVEKTQEELRADFAESALPSASQLALGILKLEETEYSVDSELAVYLTPYWKLYKSLLDSDTTAQEELDALINEVQELMDPDQVNYIASLELTQEDLMTYMNDSGFMENMWPVGTNVDGTGDPNHPDGMPDGMGPGGGQGRGQGGPGGIEGLDPETQATMQAEREARGGAGGMGANRMMVPLIDALIELLEGKVEG
jgi:hypothetical protein